jgi:P4 family phage/plasmid primase-like protien
MNLYCSRLYDLQDDFMSGLAEKPQEYMPILSDIDIKLNVEDHPEFFGHFYSQDQVTRIIEIYHDVIKQIVKDVRPEHLVCFVLEKPCPYVIESNIKNGFHLHWPFVYLSQSDIEIHLVPRIKQIINDQNIFADLDIEKSGDVVDTCISKNNWLMYGSRKDISLTAYKLTRIINAQSQEISLEEVMSHNKIVDRFDQNIITEEYPVEYYLPYILSIHNLGRPIYKVKAGTECVIKRLLTRADTYKDVVVEQLSFPQTIQLVRTLMAMISPVRADKYMEWMNMGWALWNITKGTYEGLEIWCQFSAKTSKNNFDEAKCVYEWNKMNPGNYNMGTLRNWAKQDNPRAYEEFLALKQQERISESLRGGQNDLAKLLYDKYHNTIVCADLRSNKWFYFDNHRWRDTQIGTELYKKIDTELVPKFLAESQSTLSRVHTIREDGTPHINPEDAQRVKKLMSLVERLKSSDFKNKIMAECKHMFHRPDFYEKLNRNLSLLGFENGVLDLDEMRFREGRPEDYISMSCKYNYKEFKSFEDPEITELLMFWLKVLPETEVRNWFLDYCGKILKGGNDDQNFLIMSGKGANGKTMVIEMMQQALGDYADVFPTSLLTGKEAASNACSPALIKSIHKRFMYISEPDTHDNVNVGMMKRLTGGEKVDARGLYEAESADFRPNFKFAYICNNLPKLPEDDDGGTWRRLLLLNFKSWFPPSVSQVPATWKEQLEQRIFHRDTSFQSKIPKMRQAMMWFMFQLYKRVVKRQVHQDIPAEVTSALERYKRQNDVYLQFIDEVLYKEQGASISLNDFYSEFVNWFRESFSTNKVVSKNDLRAKMVHKWGNLVNNRWSGWRVRRVEDDINEGLQNVVNNPVLAPPTVAKNTTPSQQPQVASVPQKEAIEEEDEEEEMEEEEMEEDFGSKHHRPIDLITDQAEELEEDGMM